ncbi:23S rRNA (uracil(1939)-C(5))-methyltransferase RlmD [Treponema rectale]|uniref:23S rRNA (Uracil(1939)-C(5))-methyltransferase RlmD n=1 Tax=Treponema rectale TaxID=744512 RepID=A0A7M1XJE1_9SPIR|nr:23S rRNA (uracil(1939)-C(5))-methyltransferase RlmD [Treponema rectale]
MSRRITKTTCLDLDDFGKGIVRIDDTTCFIDNLLPGEEADIETDFKYGKLAKAKAINRYNDSPDRVHPECKYYPNCGGCQLMHLSYEKQLEYKTKKVKELLHKFAKLDVEVYPCIGLENPTRFRNKVQKPVRFDNKKKKIKAGFYQSGTHNLIGVEDCLMETPLSNKISNLLVSLFEKYHFTPYHEDAQFGLIRHILIKTNTNQDQALVTLIVTRSDIKGIKDFAKELMKKIPQVVGVVLNINTRKTNVILGEKDVPVFGHTKIQDMIFDKKFLISTQSFYQVNSHQIETLYGKAIEFAQLKKTDSLLDAYCGTGTIGLCCADKVKDVLGVEIVADAVHDAILNAKINNLTNAHFIKGDATKFILQSDKHFDVIIMDPPRKGSTPEFINAVKRIAPERVVYVSCDPVTLARDLALFKDAYQIEKVQPVDMFPNSMHVETVCCLIKR